VHHRRSNRLYLDQPFRSHNIVVEIRREPEKHAARVRIKSRRIFTFRACRWTGCRKRMNQRRIQQGGQYRR